MAATDPVVLYEVAEGVARITLNRPAKRNALNDDLIAGLKVLMCRAHEDDEVRVILLTGAGSDFCSGADLAALQKISTASVEENLEDAAALMELFRSMRSTRQPVIAAVRGRALAGGCGLASACDLVLAARSSRFGYPEVKIGFVPAMVMAILRRNVSEKRAFELLSLGNELSAEEAVNAGLANRVIDDEAFDDEVDAFVEQFARVSSSAVALTKKLLYQIDAMSFEDALRCGVDTNVTARLTKDCKQGVERFLRKR
ncbi:MAG TPA: enoyl-CoA hydratase-related protein [Pyrinomonadaceae bacterium]|jgi:methylglutaconyl-CoA hydratase|nr:enoyl-CoA hydratase-related protein [Pyrinomonadaceae bacterium]